MAYEAYPLIVYDYYFSISEDYYERDIVDQDDDGWTNWGIGDPPPEFNQEDLDSDDFNNRIGPFDQNYYGKSIMPEVSVIYGGGITTEIQIDNNGMITFPLQSYGKEYEFTIRNSGDAKLHLPYTTNLRVQIPAIYQNDFEVSQYPTAAKINIEEDMDDFIFVLALADCGAQAELEEISGLVYWENCDIKLGDVKVKSGAELRIYNIIGFADDADLIIEMGGRVVLDNGHLTMACDERWEGVDVIGHPTMSQALESYHGIIEALNGSSIQYAEVGIETIPYEFDHGSPTGGGIIYSENSYFINNKTDVKFYPFQNTHPITGENFRNLSYFTRCEFLTTEMHYITYPDEDYPEIHIQMNGVDGIPVKGCIFENTYNESPTNIDQRGIGILSYNSGFSVDYYIQNIPEEIRYRSMFKQMDYGIYALNGRITAPLSIDSCLFENNRRGIYISAHDSPEIIYNEFSIRNEHCFYNDADTMVGLYMDAFTTGFTVEENVFYTTIDYEQLSNKKCAGIIANNTGTVPNEIYNNNFNNIHLGISAQGKNRAETGEGLCLKCNDFTDCVIDISVLPNLDEYGQPITGSTIGIAIKQGEIAPEPPIGEDPDPKYAAGNTFSEYLAGVNNYFNDPDCQYLEYTHHPDNNPEVNIIPQNPTNIGLVGDPLVQYSKELACPSNLSSTGGINESTEKSILNSELLLINSYQDSLTTYVDGGDTEELNTDVTFSLPEEAIELRQQLLNESPYLSDTVMKSAIGKEEVLPNAMIRDILVANPQSAKKPDVIQSIDNRYEPMPGYMMGEIMEGLNITGAKEKLERKLAKHKTRRMKSLLKLEHHYNKDTANISTSLDSLIALWEREPFPESWYKMSFQYLVQKDSLSFNNTLDSIPTIFELSEIEQILHQQYEELFEILWPITVDSINPDSNMIENLIELSQNNNLPGVYAKNYLISKNMINYHELVFFPDLLKTAPEYPTISSDDNRDKMMKVFPNPANNYYIIEYDLKVNYENSFISVCDITGKYHEYYKIKNIKDQKVFDCKDYPSGIYLIQLNVGSEIIEVVKVSITK